MNIRIYKYVCAFIPVCQSSHFSLQTKYYQKRGAFAHNIHQHTLPTKILSQKKRGEIADLKEVAAHLPARRRPSAHLSPGGRNQRLPNALRQETPSPWSLSFSTQWAMETWRVKRCQKARVFYERISGASKIQPEML